MLVILLAAGNGLANGAENAFRDDATNSVWLFPSRTTKAHKGQPKGRAIRMTNEDYNLVLQSVPLADHVTARYRPRGDSNVSRSGRQGVFSVRAVHPDHQYLERTTITQGRYINTADVEQRRKVAVTGSKVIAVLFPRGEDPLGRMISIGKSNFTVVGVFNDQGDQDEQETIYIPLSTGQIAFGGSHRIDQLMFTVGGASVAAAEAVVDDLRRRMATRHGYDPEDKGAIRIRNNHFMHQKLVGVLWAIRSFVWLIGMGTILAGVVGVGNIMLISVKERTKEFGIRKALGATPASIVLMVIEEALVVTTVAGYVGLVLAVAAVEFGKQMLPDNEMFENPTVDLGVGLAATGILVVAGLLAGLWPARRAARVHPVEAFRAEG